MVCFFTRPESTLDMRLEEVDFLERVFFAVGSFPRLTIPPILRAEETTRSIAEPRSPMPSPWTRPALVAILVNLEISWESEPGLEWRAGILFSLGVGLKGGGMGGGDDYGG